MPGDTMRATISDMKPGGPLRAVLAWIGACFFGVVVCVLVAQAVNAMNGGVAPSPDLFWFATLMMTFGAMLTATPFAVAMIFLVRETGVRRPWADVFGAALVAVVGLHASDLLLGGYFAGLHPWTPFVMIGGLVAGAVYWLLAGKPRPPYAAK